MVPQILKELLVPGSYSFLLIVLTVATLLLYRAKDGGRAGRFLMTLIVVGHLILSVPLAALALVSLSSPDYPPVQTRDQARGASAIVVMGAGMHVHQSRGEIYATSTREDALRLLEAVRVYRVLDRPWVVVAGGLGLDKLTEAKRMAEELRAMGIPADRIVEEGTSTNTHDSGINVPPLLRERHVEQFVLVTSRPHIERAMRVFRKGGYDPIPSSPEVYASRSKPWSFYVPSDTGLYISQQMIYGELAMGYYWLRGWI